MCSAHTGSSGAAARKDQAGCDADDLKDPLCVGFLLAGDNDSCSQGKQ